MNIVHFGTKALLYRCTIGCSFVTNDRSIQLTSSINALNDIFSLYSIKGYECQSGCAPDAQYSCLGIVCNPNEDGTPFSTCLCEFVEDPYTCLGKNINFICLHNVDAFDLILPDLIYMMIRA